MKEPLGPAHVWCGVSRCHGRTTPAQRGSHGSPPAMWLRGLRGPCKATGPAVWTVKTRPWPDLPPPVPRLGRGDKMPAGATAATNTPPCWPRLASVTATRLPALAVSVLGTPGQNRVGLWESCWLLLLFVLVKKTGVFPLSPKAPLSARWVWGCAGMGGEGAALAVECLRHLACCCCCRGLSPAHEPVWDCGEHAELQPGRTWVQICAQPWRLLGAWRAVPGSAAAGRGGRALPCAFCQGSREWARGRQRGLQEGQGEPGQWWGEAAGSHRRVAAQQRRWAWLLRRQARASGRSRSSGLFPVAERSARAQLWLSEVKRFHWCKQRGCVSPVLESAAVCTPAVALHILVQLLQAQTSRRRCSINWGAIPKSSGRSQELGHGRVAQGGCRTWPRAGAQLAWGSLVPGHLWSQKLCPPPPHGAHPTCTAPVQLCSLACEQVRSGQGVPPRPNLQVFTDLDLEGLCLALPCLWKELQHLLEVLLSLSVDRSASFRVPTRPWACRNHSLLSGRPALHAGGEVPHRPSSLSEKRRSSCRISKAAGK